MIGRQNDIMTCGHPQGHLYYQQYIYKAEQNAIANYRPLSLTNGDYKIADCVFAKRLNTFLPSIISSDEVAYIK